MAYKDKAAKTAYNKEYRARDKEKWNAYAREWQRKLKAKDPEGYKAKKKARNLKAYYGLTLDERNALLALQGGACAGCGTDNPGGQDWNVDHCHDTGAIRGILCHKCNKAVGFAADKPGTLRALANYIERFQ